MTPTEIQFMGYEHDSYQNQFLVSMPQLDRSNFHRSVVLICKHDSEGAIGIVINRLTNHTMADIFEQLDLNVSSSINLNQPIHAGGPVYPELGLIIHSGTATQWESSLQIGEDLILTSSTDILADLAQGKGPERMLMSLGYSGWDAGQLEHEMQQNSWFITPVDNDILFEVEIAHKWKKSANLIGIDVARFSSLVGHA